MPRLTRSIPRYRSHRASGQAVVDINGRSHYLGPYNTKASKVEYDRLIEEWLSSGRSPSFGIPNHALTVLELAVAYLEYAKEYYGDNKRGEYRNVLNALRVIRQLYSELPATEFRPMQLKAVRHKLIAKGHARKYINDTIRRIRRVFRWGASEGLIPVEVHQTLDTLDGLRMGHTTAPEGAEIVPVDDAFVAATLPHLSATVRAMVELHQLTGMRPGEVCILRPCDVDRTGEVWEYKPTEHKNMKRGKKRTVYFGVKAQAILLPYLLRDPNSFCFSPAEVVAKQLAERNAARKTPMSCGNSAGTNRKKKPKRRAGIRYTAQSYCYAIYRACDRAFPVPEAIAEDAEEVAKWRREHRWAPNRLRHALGTKVGLSFGLEGTKAVLGHSKVDMAAHYAAIDRMKAIEVTKQIG